VDLAHGGRHQRLAAGAAADPQGGVEAVEGGGVQAAQRDLAQSGQDRPVDVALVGDPGAPGEVGDLEPACQELGDGCVGGWSLALVDLGEQPGAECLGLALGPRRAGEVAALAGDRVVAGVDDDLPGVAALADVALCQT
jgi:hypothetical protein